MSSKVTGLPKTVVVPNSLYKVAPEFQFFVRAMSQLELVCPYQVTFGAMKVMLRSMESFAVLLTKVALSPLGKVPRIILVKLAVASEEPVYLITVKLYSAVMPV